jgi:hypothetical protein
MEARMIGSFNFYKKASGQDDLAAGFMTELASIDKAEQSAAAPVITTADVVGLVIKCAEELEAAQLDTAPADETLSFFETEIL